MIINSEKLSKELTTAGIIFSGCDSGGQVLDMDNQPIQEQPDVAAVIAKHNPEPDYAEKRQMAYLLAGITDHEIIIALWEMVVENKPEYAKALQIKRLDIKSQIPKKLL